MEEPTDTIQGLHREILAGNPIAFSQLCEFVLPILQEYIETYFGYLDSQMQTDIVDDSILRYGRQPTLYDEARGHTLLGYLKMDIRGDARNAVERASKQEKRVLEFSDEFVELERLARNTVQDEEELFEWLQDYTNDSPGVILEEIRRELSPTDLEIAIAMASGERKTEVFAEILGIADRPPEEQRTEVKRAKDRISKQLQRFGKKRTDHE